MGTKKEPPKRLFLSRRDSVDIAWEHGAFLHIRYSDAEEAGSDTLEADGEAAVRGHAVYPRPSAPLSGRPSARAATLRARSAPTAHPRL